MMTYLFKILHKNEINSIIPMVQELSETKIPNSVLEARFREIVTQNYECAVVYDNEKLIGVTGLWYCTRHYSGKSVELDHVIIDGNYR